MIKVLDPNLKRLCVLNRITSSSRCEEINGENTLNFKSILDLKIANYIYDTSIFEIDNDYFDLGVYTKDANEDKTYTVEVETDHVSYRLNKPEYNVEYFAQTGTPEFILGQILEGTGFTVGVMEFTTAVTYSAQEAKSRRQLLVEFATYIGGELDFNKFEIGIVVKRGSRVRRRLIQGKNINVVSKSVNKREIDETGMYSISYTCEPTILPKGEYGLGDDVLLIQNGLGIREELRVISIKYDPYDPTKTTLVFSNMITGMDSALYQIATSTVIKDKLYNGARIGPEFGFESVRNDKKARSYFRSDGMAFQSGDGTGETWRDRMYFEYNSELDETSLVFDGKLSAAVIDVIKLTAQAATIAGFDIIQKDEVTKDGGLIYDHPVLGKFIRISPYSSMVGDGTFNEAYGAIDLGLSEDGLDTLAHIRSDGYVRFGLKGSYGASIRFNDFLNFIKEKPGSTDTIFKAATLQIDRGGVVTGGGNAPVYNVTASRMLTPDDEQHFIVCNSASDISLTIPNYTAEGYFSKNAEIVILRYGTGNVIIGYESFVTLRSVDNKRSIGNQYETITLKHFALGEWIIFGV